MESFLPDSVKAILLGLIAVVFVLSRLSYRFPDVDWLQHFRLPIRHLSEEEKRRQRRRASLMAGMEIILAGMVLPLLYIAAKVMMFNEPTTLGDGHCRRLLARLHRDRELGHRPELQVENVFVNRELGPRANP